MTNNKLHTYLSQVRNALEGHPEADDIVKELQEHIWDLANNLSTKMGYSVDEAFSTAIRQMEEPEALARSFREEQGTIPWAEPRSALPEKKLSEQEFVLLAIIGFLASTIVLAVISWVGDLTETDLTPVSFVVRLLQLLLLIMVAVTYLYFRNQQEFEEQLRQLHERFRRIEEREEVREELRAKIRALSTHISGLLYMLWGFLVIAFVLYITFSAEIPVFNDNWLSIGLYLVIIQYVAEIIEGTIRMFVGEIRMSRIIHSISELVTFGVSIALIIFYPFDLGGWLPTVTHPAGRPIAKLILDRTFRPDYWFRIFIGIAGVFALMEVFYNLAKFQTWKPSEQRSLTVRSQEGIL